MSYKKKYKKGEMITSFYELEKQEFIYIVYGSGFEKVLHEGFFKCWQFRLLELYIRKGMVYRAVREIFVDELGKWLCEGEEQCEKD